jgi:transposase
VADRFHLLKNLSEQVAQALARQPPRAPALETSQTSSPAPVVPPTPIPPPLSQAAKQQRYEQICCLRAEGLTIRAIAAAVGSTRATVDRWLARGAPNQPRAYSSRRAPPRQGSRPKAQPPRLSPKQGAWLLVSDPTALGATQRARLQQLLEQQPELEPLYQLAQRFVQLVKHGQDEQLADWLAQAHQCAWVELRQLAQGLAQDAQAVRAALRLPQSNGVVEGQITRLKLLKRSMYGRASFELLRRRVLLRR